MRSIHELLAKLNKVKEIKLGQYIAISPGHYDTQQSLSISEAEAKGGYINNLRGIVQTLYHQDEVKEELNNARL